MDDDDENYYFYYHQFIDNLLFQRVNYIPHLEQKRYTRLCKTHEKGRKYQ